jgi:hypothetical protein
MFQGRWNWVPLVFLQIASCTILESGIPFQIVRPSEQTFEINPEGLHVLESYTEPIAIIGVVGPYHSGKNLYSSFNVETNRQIVSTELFAGCSQWVLRWK